MFNTVIDSSRVFPELHNPDWAIIDCRYDLASPDAGRDAYLKSHIPGAVYADLHDDLSGPPLTDHGRHPLPSVDHLVELFVRLGISNFTQVIAYDDISGAFAARLWWLLRLMGHEAVAVLDGGWSHWLSEKLPQVSGTEGNSKGRFIPNPQKNFWITAAQVKDEKLLIDSRDPARYRGDIEPLDKAAGHIPGAINYFWKNNLDENGLFLDKDQLAEKFAALLKQTASEESTFYCGSGVTACHNLLAAVHSGLAMPRLYAGSWSDWCSSPGRPIATGPEPGTPNL